jgi:uncharacterized membrane protein
VGRDENNDNQKSLHRSEPLFVPKRIGVGWTFNWNNPWSIIIIVTVVVLGIGGIIFQVLSQYP